MGFCSFTFFPLPKKHTSLVIFSFFIQFFSLSSETDQCSLGSQLTWPLSVLEVRIYWFLLADTYRFNSLTLSITMIFLNQSLFSFMQALASGILSYLLTKVIMLTLESLLCTLYSLSSTAC